MTQFESDFSTKNNNNSSESDLYKFKNKLDNESYSRLIEKRNQIFIRMGYKVDRSVSCQNLWEKKPVDFTRKLYRPQPPKRNTRDAIRPWEYDKFLRTEEEESIFWEKPEEKKKANELMIEKSFINNSSFEDWKKDFERQFRVPDPLEAKIQASKAMSFREGLDQYQNPKDHDFRGYPRQIYGLPEFTTKYERDPLKIKFKSKNLDKFNGFSDTSLMRVYDNDQQMGDLIQKQEPNFNPKLVLPRLQFPNKYEAYSRYRTGNASADDAYYERLIPSLNKKWAEEKMNP